MKVLEAIQLGAYASIQDSGRKGFRSFAIPQSGCLDPVLQQLSNYLTNNESGAPVHELIGGRFVFKCLVRTTLGIVGIEQKVTVNKKGIDTHTTLHLHAGDEMVIETQLSYLSIGGSLVSSIHFESASAYPIAGLGNKPLKKGDFIEATINPTISDKRISKNVLSKISTPTIIRVISGPEWETARAKDFEEKNWEVSRSSNRMGMRLIGPPIKTKNAEMVSVPTFVGTIQLPPDGQPIVLLNDAQTTGGYPRIGQVIKADLPRIARLVMGGTIRFKFVTIDEARYIFHRQQSFIKNELEST
jgi:biotin-dependent carboxylase-like uncharacterized protein